MIRALLERQARKWDNRALLYRREAAKTKELHDALVNAGGRVSLASFEVYAGFIGKAEDCEKRAARWRR